jgi:lysine-N-methylase
MPLSGPAFGDQGTFAVTMVDGRCGYLDSDGRCSLHTCGGAAAKPRGCRDFPAAFVDDGEVVRVSVLVECACVLMSAEKRGGEPLVPPEARLFSELEPGTRALSLPEQIAVSDEESVGRRVLVAWSRAIRDIGGADVPGAVWALADAAPGGLDAERAAAAMRAPRPLLAPDLSPWIAALAERARAVLDLASWRSKADPVRVTLGWIAEASTRLSDAAALARALDDRSFAAQEAFWLRASIHGYHMVDELPLDRALRERAVRLVVARALPAIAADEHAARYPLAVVEAMMRGHGLKAYAALVSGGRGCRA